MAEKWMDRLDLPEETMPGEALVEIVGHRRVLVERHCGVTEYGSHTVAVKMKFGCIRIHGSQLELTRMTREQLIVSGCIHCVSIERNGVR